MTVCVYLNHKNKHYLGADSLLVCGDFKSRYSNYSKIVRLDGGFAAWAGNVDIKRILQNLKASKISTEKDVYKFADKIISKIKDRFADDFNFEIILYNGKKAYLLDRFGECFEIDKYCAIGSGAPYSLGALDVLTAYEIDSLTGEEMVENALMAAENYDVNVGRPFIVEKV